MFSREQQNKIMKLGLEKLIIRRFNANPLHYTFPGKQVNTRGFVGFVSYLISMVYNQEAVTLQVVGNKQVTLRQIGQKGRSY